MGKLQIIDRSECPEFSEESDPRTEVHVDSYERNVLNELARSNREITLKETRVYYIESFLTPHQTPSLQQLATTGLIRLDHQRYDYQFG